MVVCKFFQQGTCRYGQSCRFEHVYGSKYNYYAKPSPQLPSQSAELDGQLIAQVQADIQSALQGSQWILSSYAPFKDKPAIPGLRDLSPEEVRLFVYEAQSSNNLDEAVTYVNNLVKENRNKYEELLKPTSRIVQALRTINRGETPDPPFTVQHTASLETNATSIFRKAVQNTPVFGQNNISATPSIFSQNINATNQSSVFGQDKTSSVFGQPNASAAKSLFAQASENLFGPPQIQNQNVFSNTSNASNLFASASQSAFGLNTGPNVSPFQNQGSTNTFQKQDSSNVFSQNSLQKLSDNDGFYSKLEDLAEGDLEAFRSEKFQLGFIPEVPPPQSLCL